MTLSRSLLLALAVLVLAQGVYFYSRMPDAVASHFDAAGVPNGHQSKDVFFLLVGVVFATTFLCFAGAEPLLRAVPARLWNLPHRDYWLAEEREVETRRFVAVQMEWFGVATMLLLALTLQLVYEANLSEQPRLDGSLLWWLLGGYTLVTVLWLVRLLSRFRLPPDAGA